jgi:hypothetical protein
MTQTFFGYQAGVNPVTGYGGTFSRADASTCATYINASGLVTTVAANIPRFAHYDPTNGGPSLLLEGSRQNLAVQSRTMTGVSWSTVTASVATNQVGTDGAANSATFLKEDATVTTTHSTALSVSKAASALAYAYR